MTAIERLQGPAYDWPRKHSYLALDVPSWTEAEKLLARFGAVVDGFKVGLELFCSAGHRPIDHLVNNGKRVFLDVKLHDIPNTVAGALRSLRDTGVELVNVHALGGRRMMEAARNALEGGARPSLIAVTALTSLDDTSLDELLLPNSGQLVPALAALAHESGLDGVVASATDLEAIYASLPKSFVTVVPGTRVQGTALHDQARTATPFRAIQSGATHLVIGRAVTQAENPWQALTEIWDEMRAGCEERGDFTR